MIHALKIKPEYFKAVANSDKLFEVRKADRPFRVGDYLALNEIDDCGVYTGAHILAWIKYILNDPEYCKEGFVVLGLSVCSMDICGRYEDYGKGDTHE